MLLQDTKAGDVIVLFIKDNQELSPKPTGKTLTCTVIADMVGSGTKLLGWKDGDVKPLFCQPRNGTMNSSYLYILAQKEYTWGQTCPGGYEVVSILAKGAGWRKPTSKECPCGIHRADCDYHR